MVFIAIKNISNISEFSIFSAHIIMAYAPRIVKWSDVIQDPIDFSL